MSALPPSLPLLLPNVTVPLRSISKRPLLNFAPEPNKHMPKDPLCTVACVPDLVLLGYCASWLLHLWCKAKVIERVLTNHLQLLHLVH